MTRTWVITGSASGIGAATRDYVEAHGDTVIGVDISGSAEVHCDLGTNEGRAEMVRSVQAMCESVDTIVANAGIGPLDNHTVRVNYFGALATLEGLRPLLSRSLTPRAVATSSLRSIGPTNAELEAALLCGEEELAATIADALASGGALAEIASIYATSKRALNKWIQHASTTESWAGAGIPLNAVAPGIFATASTSHLIADENWLAERRLDVPTPLGGLPGRPEEVAHAIAWLGGPSNTRITGQTIFVDGGAHLLMGQR